MNRDDLERRIGARSFARLLGDWRPPEGRGLADALADRIRLLVLDGRLPLQTRVPAERELAAALLVSRTTVAGAYDALRVAGVLRSRRGSGSWTQLPEHRGGGHLGPFAPLGDTSLFDLAHAALPAPSEQLRSSAAAALHDFDAHLGGHGYDLAGLPVLRAAIADRYTARGLPTGPDQVLVTAGAMNAITIALTALTGPGDRVLVEHPTYPNALQAIATRGARAVPVPMAPQVDGASAWDLELLTAAVRDAAPRLTYLIPDFQNPTGALLDAAGRERLVDLARRTGTPLVVDETLAELALDTSPVRPVAAHGAADSPLVLTVGSASKIFWGGLRVGWIRTSAPMVRRLAAARAPLDLGGPTLEHLVVARLLPEVEAVAATRRAELTAARDDLLTRLAAAFPGWRPARPCGGLSLWIDLDEPVSSRLTVAARRHDVLLAAGPRFGLDGAFERHLRLPYTLRPDRMAAALDRLARAWQDLDRAAPTTDVEPVAVA
ncbi:MocR-like transcription factor YczR [Pseudonocardia nigra]|uniref:MocR-like transcription factor YczR n=1 Tax=Pseudonocardia nigra TaxID=1921578 RepID=UPI0027E32B84|nr:PLP-dependent aminotransferase family protein [Pseudonocardia nigra]